MLRNNETVETKLQRIAAKASSDTCLHSREVYLWRAVCVNSASMVLGEAGVNRCSTYCSSGETGLLDSYIDASKKIN